MVKVIAGQTYNYKGEKVIAIHVPGRKNRVLLTFVQTGMMERYFNSRSSKILSEKGYAILRKNMSRSGKK